MERRIRSQPTKEPRVRRNSAEEFARRTLANIKALESLPSQCNVYPVTHLATSLLGLVVFPWETNVIQGLKKKRLAQLYADGWPRWNILLPKDNGRTTLRDLAYHLRNAAAHGRVEFSSDSQEYQEVSLVVEDWKPGDQQAYWRAEISADQLRCFCSRLAALILGQVE